MLSPAITSLNVAPAGQPAGQLSMATLPVVPSHVAGLGGPSTAPEAQPRIVARLGLLVVTVNWPPPGTAEVSVNVHDTGVTVRTRPASQVSDGAVAAAAGVKVASP